MNDCEKKIHRKEIAKRQLETAVNLFLKNMDLSSVITLAGAASNILSQLVRNSGQEPFIDYARSVCSYFNGNTPARKSYNHYIDVSLGIIAHKHMSEDCSETASLDLEKCAVDALTRAISDYITLYGQDENFIKAFLSWSYKNKGADVMAACKDMPDKFKKQMRKENGKERS